MDGAVTVLHWPKKNYLISADVHIKLDGEDMGILKDKDITFLLADGRHTLRMYRAAGASVMDVAEARFFLADGGQVTVAYRPSMVAGQNAALALTGCETYGNKTVLTETKAIRRLFRHPTRI
jgi:hypothetical protein